MDKNTKEFIIKKLQNRRDQLEFKGFTNLNERRQIAKEMEQRLANKGITVDYSLGSDLGIAMEYNEDVFVDVLKKALVWIEKAEAEIAELDKAIESMKAL